MLWFIIFPIVCGLIGALFGALDAAESAIGFVLGAIVGGVIALCFNAGFTYSGGTTLKRTSTIPLVSIATGTEIHGGGFLFVTSIDSGTAYYYFTRQRDGGYVRGQIDDSDYDSVEVYQTNQQTPHIEFWAKIIKSNSLSVFAVGEHDRDYVKIYVPPGSIVRSYTLKP